jgi:Dolichyl-phosphate-mannose-protein mannosyltransferase
MKLSHRKKIAIIFIAAFVLFMAVPLMRWLVFDNESIIGFPTYMHQRIAEDMLSGKFNWFDNLSYGGRPYTYQPFFSMGVAFFGLVMPIEAAGIVFVALFGAIAILSIYLIAEKMFPQKSYISALVLALTPVTIYMFSHLSTRSPPIALSLLALYLLLYGGSRRYIYSGLLLGAAALIHVEVAIVFGIIFLFLSYKDKKIFRTLIIAAVIAAIWFVPFLLTNGFPEYNSLYESYREMRYSLESPTLENYLFEIYQWGHLTVIFSVLAIIGFVKTKNNFLRAWALFSFILTLIAERFFMYLAFPLSLLSLTAILWLLNEKKHIGKFIVILALAYIIFFGAVKVELFSQDSPTKEQYNAFLFIKNVSDESDTILTDWSWGHWVSGIAKRKNFMDGYAEYAPEASQRMEMLKKFYETCEIPEGYGIKYIYMENWFSQKYNITCLDRFPIVYNASWIFVYKV